MIMNQHSPYRTTIPPIRSFDQPPKNLMNCETCDYHKMNDDPNLHCYMFKTPPEEYCRIHTGFKNSNPIAQLFIN